MADTDGQLRDYLLNPGEFFAYERNLEVTDQIPRRVLERVNNVYERRENDIEYIFYTGMYCKDNFKHSIDEIYDISCSLEIESYSWCECVIKMGASVVWKNRD